MFPRAPSPRCAPVLGVFEFSRQMQTIEIFSPRRDPAGNLAGIEHEIVFYDPEAFAQPLRLVQVRHLIFASPSVSSMFVPHGSLMNAIEIPRAGTSRYDTVSGIPAASSFFVNASRFSTSKPM